MAGVLSCLILRPHRPCSTSQLTVPFTLYFSSSKYFPRPRLCVRFPSNIVPKSPFKSLVVRGPAVRHIHRCEVNRRLVRAGGRGGGEWCLDPSLQSSPAVHEGPVVPSEVRSRACGTAISCPQKLPRCSSSAFAFFAKPILRAAAIRRLFESPDPGISTYFSPGKYNFVSAE